jgi:hypothetical protein
LFSEIINQTHITNQHNCKECTFLPSIKQIACTIIIHFLSTAPILTTSGMMAEDLHVGYTIQNNDIGNSKKLCPQIWLDWYDGRQFLQHSAANNGQINNNNLYFLGTGHRFNSCFVSSSNQSIQEHLIVQNSTINNYPPSDNHVHAICNNTDIYVTKPT